MRAILFFFVIYHSFTVSSQQHSFEIKGGLNITNIYKSSHFKNTEELFRLTTGVGYSYKFKNALTLGASILYQENGFKEQLIFTDVYGNVLNINDIFMLVEFENISIPLKIGIQTNSKRMLFFGSLGIVPALNLGSRLKSPNIDENIDLIDYTTSDFPIRQIQMSAQLNFAFGFKLTEHFILLIEGAMQMGFTNLFDNNLIKGYNTSSSINLGLRYQL